MEKLNEWVEQASRVVEYKYGQQERDTAEGRMKAFQNSQDVTVDFSRSGNSELAYMLKKTVPFFNACMQGAYRTARLGTEAERGRLGARLTKIVLNTGLMSALAAGLILKFGDDDDKEEFMMLSDGIKANHLILPNPFGSEEEGAPPFIRIPLAQDPIGYAIHGLVTNALVKGSDDEMALSLAATADVILDNLNPLGSGSIIQPFIDVSHNRTWYGSNLVRTMQADWVDKAGQYNEDTPDFFKAIGRLINTSPEVVEYLTQQYTGFLGALAIPTLSNESDGGIGGLNALKNSIVRKWTSDPATSNDVTQDFYNMKNALATITSEAKAGRAQGLLLRSLTQEEVDTAYELADSMAKSGGIIKETSDLISDTYKRIDEINANRSLTDTQKAKMARDERMNMLKQVEEANEQMMAYYKKYIRGESLTDRALGEIQKRLTAGKTVHIKNDVEKMPEVFQNDTNSVYMQRATSLYGDPSSEGYQKAASVPHPSRKLTITDKYGNEEDYVIPDDEWPIYTEMYRREYESYVLRKGARWDTMSDADRFKLLKNAHSSANKTMREAYAKNNGIK